MRSLLIALMLGSLATAAHAQTAASSPDTLTTGKYSGRVQGPKAASDVDLTIKHITPDGRITGTMLQRGGNPACAKPLPANGVVKKNGEVRIEVNDGAPEGCERISDLTLKSGGSLTGTSIVGGKSYPIELSKR